MFKTTETRRLGVTIIAGAVLLTSAAVQMAQAVDGKAIYDKNCVSCHGASGKGDGPASKVMKPPPDFATGLKSMGDADIAKLVKEGGQAPKKHPAFGQKLNDEQITTLVQYVKGLAK
jgi:cytochrome c oxidase cbb3-type subunit 2/cytochrome c oxidase cbb3-type subunit I/II